MKLYLLENTKTHKIVGMSEEKMHIYGYIIQNSIKDRYKVITVDNRKEIEKCLILYEDSIIEEFEGTYISSVERRIIDKTIEEERCRVRDVAQELLDIVNDYDLDKKDHKILNQAISVLIKNSKRKKLQKILKIKDFILSIFKKDVILDEMKQEIMKKDGCLYIDINIKK